MLFYHATYKYVLLMARPICSFSFILTYAYLTKKLPYLLLCEVFEYAAAAQSTQSIPFHLSSLLT